MTAYWWVNQNQTWKHERAGGYLWAPFEDSNGVDKYYWSLMEEVKIGDIVFSYVGQEIKAVSVVNYDCYHAKIPPEFGENPPWKSEGRKIDVEYQDITKPLKFSEFVNEFTAVLSDERSPLVSDKSGAKQGYLFPINPEAAAVILTEVGLQYLVQQNEITRSFSSLSEEEITTRKSLVDARIGQGKFRKKLEKRWGACAVTGVKTSELLTASHIKPWKKSDNIERLDTNNGILLLSTIDKAFDRGLITFSNSGEIILSKYANKDDIIKAGMNESLKLKKIYDEMRPFLDYHREFIFEGKK